MFIHIGAQMFIHLGAQMFIHLGAQKLWYEALALIHLAAQAAATPTAIATHAVIVASVVRYHNGTFGLKVVYPLINTLILEHHQVKTQIHLVSFMKEKVLDSVAYLILLNMNERRSILKIARLIPLFSRYLGTI